MPWPPIGSWPAGRAPASAPACWPHTQLSIVAGDHIGPNVSHSPPTSLSRPFCGWRGADRVPGSAPPPLHSSRVVLSDQLSQLDPPLTPPGTPPGTPPRASPGAPAPHSAECPSSSLSLPPDVSLPSALRPGSKAAPWRVGQGGPWPRSPRAQETPRPFHR